MKESKWIWFLIISFFVTVGVARAEEPKDTFKCSVKMGYHFVGHSDEKTKVGEYETLSSGPDGGVDFDAVMGKFLFGGHMFYYDTRDKEWSGYLDYARIIRSNYSYNSFIHRTRHDSLFANKDKTSDGFTAINPFAWLWNGSEYELEGAQKAKYTDLDTGRDYQIHRSEQKWDTEFQAPSFPYVIPEISIRQEVRKGWRQHTFMAGKCAACHVVGTGLRVDERTTDIKAGGTLKYGIITASYFHTERDFDNKALANYYNFDGVGGDKAVYRSRLLYDYSTSEFGETPEVQKHMDSLKARVRLPHHSTFYSSYVYSRVVNNTTDNSYNMDTYFARLTTLLLNNKLSISGHFKYYNLDNEDVIIDLNNYNIVNIAADTSVSGPGYGGLPVTYWNYDRKSSMSRVVTETGVDFNYNIAPRYSLIGGYTLKRLERDTNYSKEYFNTALANDRYLDDGTTTYNMFKLALNARTFNSLTGRVSYEFYHAKSPFQNWHGICYGTEWYNINGPGGSDPSIDSSQPVPTPYYMIFRNVYRTNDASNVPENHHNIKLSTTWTPSAWLSANLNLQYTHEDNNNADNGWHNNTYQAGLNLWIMPVQKIYITTGYDYQKSRYETYYCADLFGG